MSTPKERVPSMGHALHSMYTGPVYRTRSAQYTYCHEYCTAAAHIKVTAPPLSPWLAFGGLEACQVSSSASPWGGSCPPITFLRWSRPSLLSLPGPSLLSLLGDTRLPREALGVSQWDSLSRSLACETRHGSFAAVGESQLLLLVGLPWEERRPASSGGGSAGLGVKAQSQFCKRQGSGSDVGSEAMGCD